jgi:hypothetical protein
MKSLVVFPLLLSHVISAFAQSAVNVDWSRTAKSLPEVENQIRAWQAEYDSLIKEITAWQYQYKDHNNRSVFAFAFVKKALALNLDRGYFVAEAFISLKDSWGEGGAAGSEMEKYPAVAKLFCFENTGTVCVKNTVWDWTNSFTSPLGVRSANSNVALKSILPSADYLNDYIEPFNRYLNELVSERQKKALLYEIAGIVCAFFRDHGFDLTQEELAAHLSIVPTETQGLKGIELVLDSGNGGIAQNIQDAQLKMRNEFHFD